MSINKRTARPGGLLPAAFSSLVDRVRRSKNERLHRPITTQISSSLEDSKQEFRRCSLRSEVTSSANLGMMLLKPELKSVSGPFNWVRLPLRLAEFGAIRQSLMNRRATVLVHEIARRAASNES